LSSESSIAGADTLGLVDARAHDVEHVRDHSGRVRVADRFEEGVEERQHARRLDVDQQNERFHNGESLEQIESAAKRRRVDLVQCTQLSLKQLEHAATSHRRDKERLEHRHERYLLNNMQQQDESIQRGESWRARKVEKQKKKNRKKNLFFFFFFFFFFFSTSYLLILMINQLSQCCSATSFNFDESLS
jgi:hypothetical protein